MSQLAGSGIAVDVPTGWEGRIYTRPSASSGARAAAPVSPQTANALPAPVETTAAVVHVASFALPPETGDFGGGAVELMTSKDLLVVLFEHGPQSAGTPLFAATSMPRLAASDISTSQLQRVLEGQGGVQRFFTTSGRAFCLYVVFGSYARRVRTLPLVNGILDTISIT